MDKKLKDLKKQIKATRKGEDQVNALDALELLIDSVLEMRK